jgi:hypothetical protein
VDQFIDLYAKRRVKHWKEIHGLLTRREMEVLQEKDIRTLRRADFLAVLDRATVRVTLPL